MTYPADMASLTSVRTARRSLPAAPHALLLALLAALLLWGGALAPASAHDTLIESDPADGDTVDGSPEAITLTYSADILDVSPLVRITDDATGESTEITPTIDGPVATAEIPEPLHDGDHTVQWRVVSSDGHPIEGTFTITVTGSTAADAADASDAGGADESPAASDGAADAPAPTEESAATAPDGEEGDGSLMPWILGGVGVLALIAVIVAVTPWKRGQGS